MKRRELKEEIDRARGSLQLLLPGHELAQLLYCVSSELAEEDRGRLFKPLAAEPDSIDLINRAPELLSAAALDRALLAELAEYPEIGEFEFRHARRVSGIPGLISTYLGMLNADAPANALPRLKLRPAETGRIEKAANAAKLAELAAVCDRFSDARVRDSSLAPLELSAARRADEFYGFRHVRKIFDEYFAAFAAGAEAAPLFITSLPGLGKTAMTIAYTLAHPELTLILPEPDLLQNGLRKLLDELGRYPKRRFVLFFDDIDPRSLDWYNFRTSIGGSFAAPGNVSCVLAANYDFPPNVLSRGRLVKFPIFDEISCQDMIEDFLIQHRLRNPEPDLIAVMAADYVEEFGQKKFAELSPRSLVRYLQIYITDREKRKKMLELSHSDLVVRPDAQLFYEQNIKLMRALYGESYIEELLKEKLRKLGGE